MQRPRGSHIPRRCEVEKKNKANVTRRERAQHLVAEGRQCCSRAMWKLMGLCMDFGFQAEVEEVTRSVAAEGIRGCGITMDVASFCSPDTFHPHPAGCPWWLMKPLH